MVAESIPSKTAKIIQFPSFMTMHSEVSPQPVPEDSAMKKIDKIDIRLWPFKVPVEGRSCDCCCTMAAGDSAGRLGVAIVGVVMSIQHSALTAKIAIMACYLEAIPT